MILIFSQELDGATQSVLDWIRFQNKSFIRMNGDSVFNNRFSQNDLLSFDNSILIDCVDSRIYEEDINVVWYRRWNTSKHFPYTKIDNEIDASISINANITKEFRAMTDIVFHTFFDKIWLSNPKTSTPNKINTLKIADKVGLSIPKTILTKSKSNLLKFFIKNKKIITKPISDFSSLFIQDNMVFLYTNEIKKKDFKSLPDYFFPILAQQKIDKLYEIRCFYLNGKIYSMAIFSQTNSQTNVDFRQYDTTRPNRTVPYNLPYAIEEKLIKLMHEMKLNTGSIDIIRSQNGEYIFLEVNPVGQFGMVSHPCNYYRTYAKFGVFIFILSMTKFLRGSNFTW